MCTHLRAAAPGLGAVKPTLPGRQRGVAATRGRTSDTEVADSPGCGREVWKAWGPEAAAATGTGPPKGRGLALIWGCQSLFSGPRFLLWKCDSDHVGAAAHIQKKREVLCRGGESLLRN